MIANRKATITIFQFVLVIIFTGTQLLAQTGHSSKITSPILHHEVDVFVGNTHIPNASIDGTSTTLILPNIGINYKYWFNDRFAIGWYNNIVIRTFVINSDSYQDLEKEYPFISTVVGVFRPWKNLSFFTGPGIEIDNNGSLFVIRLGLDYGFLLSNDWYLTPRFIYDHLGSDIDAYTLGLSIGKRF